MKAIRACIVGAGLMGRWHAWAAEKAGGQVAAVVDPNLAAASALAARHRGAGTEAELEKALREGRFEVLHVCSPSESHYRIAELALNAGLSVIVEKPLTPQAAETEILFDRAESQGSLICPVHQFLFQDGTLFAKTALSRVGKLIHLQGVFCSAGGEGPRAARLDAIAEEILPHPLSLMQAFLPTGLPESGWEISRPGRGEIRVSGEASGVSLSIFVSMNSRPTVCAFQIFGENGTIHLNLFHGYAVVEPGAVSRWRKMIQPFDLSARTLAAAAINLGRRAVQWQPAYPGLSRLVGEFYRAARAGTEPPIARADVAAVARVRELLTPRDEVAGKLGARIQR
jgi:predicted dehydrogenase